MLNRAAKAVAVLGVAGLTSGLLVFNHTNIASAATSFNFNWLGTPATPQPWHPQAMNDWDLLVHQQEMSAGSTWKTGTAGHGSDCAPSPASHQVNNENDAVFVCNNHVMTTTGDTGYGTIVLAPAQLADFSTGPVSISWKVTTLRTTTRDWIEVGITPFADNLIAPADTSVDLEGLPVNTVRCPVTDSPPSIWGCDVFLNGAVAYDSGFVSPKIEDLLIAHGLAASATTRLRYQMDVSTTRVHLWLPDLNENLIDLPVSMPFNKGIVQLSQHAYSPGKDCAVTTYMSCVPLQGTWHWSDFSISNSVPFTIMNLAPGTNGVFGGGSSTVTFNLPQPALASSFLRFLGSPGEKITYSTNGGAFAPAPIQRSTKPGQSADKNFFFAIPTGTTSVSFQGQDWAGGPWVIKDPSVWSLTTSAGPAPLSANAGAKPTTGPAPQTVSFSGAASGGVAPYSYSWNFGDGTPASPTQNPSHIYATAGTYTATLTVTDSAAKTATANAPAVTVFAPLPTVAVFPAMTNGAYGGYLTAATIQNIGSAPATVHISYLNKNGLPVGIGDTIANLAVNASWTVRQDNGNSFPSSGGDAAQAGSAVVSSSQPIASFVNEFAPGGGDATSYTGIQVPSGVGATLYAPTIVNNAYGGYTTGIGLLNQGDSPTDVTITYRDGNGAVVKTQTVSALASHAYQALYSGDTTLALPSGFAGTATITSTAGQLLGAVVNETGPGGQFSSYDAVPGGGTLLNAPVALNNVFGGYYTGMGIQNTSASAGTVSVTYYDASGTATAKSFPIAANGYLGVYQGSATDGPAPGAYTAVIQSTLPLVAIVNEVAPAGTGSARQSTSYNTFGAGSSSLHLPLVENGGSDPWNTGEGIMNTGSASTTVTVSYYDAVTGAPVGSALTQVLAPHGLWNLYQPTGGLPTGSRATAVISTSSGGQVAVVCNESSPTTFMSYNGQ